MSKKNTITTISFIGILICFISILLHLFEYLTIRDSYYNAYKSIPYDSHSLQKIEDVISEYGNNQFAMNAIKSCYENTQNLSTLMIDTMNHQKFTILISTTLWALAFIIFCHLYAKARNNHTI